MGEVEGRAAAYQGVTRHTVDAGRLLWALSLCLDFTARGVGRHHQRVAFISLSIADEMGLEADLRTLLFMAATVHDIGVQTWGEKATLQRLEVADPWEHCRRGCELLRQVGFLRPLAETIFSHHDRWAGSNPSGLTGESIPLPARIIHLADRVEVLLPERGCVLQHRTGIVKQVLSLAGQVLDPALVDVFARVSARESFWLDLVSGFLPRRLDEMGSGIQVRLDLAGLEELAALFARLIDEKSRFTYRHSRRVAALAAEVGSRLGFPPEDVGRLRVAGLLHDLGKLSIPDALLDKPARLTPREAVLFRQHPYYTYHILRETGNTEPLPQWAAYHHERLDGTGYPFRLKGEDLDLGARTVAVSDVFVAMCEDRPYRRGLSRREIEAFLSEQVRVGALDGDVVALVLDVTGELGEALCVV